jgi:hypothetical protein
MNISMKHLLFAVSSDGLAAHTAEVNQVLAVARTRHVAPLLCDVLGDRSTPEPVRARALGLIVRDLAR